MDAANFSLRTAFLFSVALLIPASAIAQPAFNVAGSGTNAATITLIGNQPDVVPIASTATPTTEITYKAQTSYTAGDAPWLCMNNNLGSCDLLTNLTTPNNIQVQIGQQASSPFFTQTQHSATITLTDTSGTITGAITVLYTPGSSGGNTSGALLATPNAINTSVAYGLQTTVFFTLSSTSSAPIQFNLGAPSVSWAYNFITTSGLSSGTIQSGAPVQVEVTLNGAGQAQTVLSSTLSVTYSGNTLNIPVTFGNGVTSTGGGGTGTGSLQFSQSAISWTYTAGGSFPAQTGVNVSSTSGAISFATTASPANSWFVVVPQSGTLPYPLTIEPTSNIASLATGAYTGIVTVTGSDGSSANITINLVVNGGSSSGLSISPNPVSLQSQLNGSIAQQSISVTSIVGGNLSAVVNGTGLTVSVSNSSISPNVASNAITVTGNPSGLANGTYIGTLTVTVGNISQAVQVNYVVGTGGNNGGGTGTGTGITAAPSALNFVYEMNSAMQINQAEQVFLAGSGNYTAAVNANGGNWLSVSSTSGTLPTQFFQVLANASFLTAGTYTGSVTFTNTSTGQTSVVSVTLLVTGTTSLYTNPGDLVFNYIAGTSSPTQVQSLSLLASDSSPIQVSAAVTNAANTPWLSISGNGGTAGLAFDSVTVNASNLSNGLYTGYITVTGVAGNSPLTVPVVLNVIGSTNSGGGTGSLTLGTSSLTFQVPVNGTAATQQLTVTAITTTSFTATASASNCNNTWLSVSPAGSTVTNTTLTVTANPAGLAAGTCNGQLTLVSSSGTQTVPVTMIVGGAGGGGNAGNITVTANGATTGSPSLTFTAQTVGGSVLPQYLTVASAAGSASVNFTAALSGTGCGWVALGITAGQAYQTPLANLNIGATTTGLAAGTYNCTLTLTPTGGTAVTVPLTLTVVGTPTISVATTALTFAYSAGSAAPAAQTIQVTATGSSASNFAATATSSGWLSVTPTSGTASSGTPATLSVSVNPANLTAGTYSGSISITAGAGTAGSGLVTVTLTVTAPTPSISTIVNGASFLGGSIAPGEFVSILGTSLGPIAPVSAALDSTGKIATSIGNVQVFFGGTAAPMIYASSGQINCIVPYEVQGLSSISVQVKYLAQPSNTVTLGVTSSAPGVFSSTGTGTGQGAIIDQSLLPNTVSTPAPKGSIVQVYVTGEGQTSPAGVTGGITGNATTAPLLPIAVKIGGVPATYTFAGELPGTVAGIMQLNVMIPPTVASGAQAVSVTIGGNTSQSGLTITVQ